jgi:hypothetical protein
MKKARANAAKLAAKRHKSALRRKIAIAKTEPGDENNQDVSSLVGKVDIRRLELLAQNDPDAYSYSGGLNRANRAFLNSWRCSRRRSRCSIRCFWGPSSNGTELPGKASFRPPRRAEPGS